jgi:hypothetical protein
MAQQQLRGDLDVTGTITMGGITLPDGAVDNENVTALAGLERSKLEQDDLVIFPVDFFDMRVWDDLTSMLPAAGANDDLGLYESTFGTGAPIVKTGDLKAAGATTRYARFTMVLPAEYVSGETITVRAHAGMKTTVSDTTATIDFSVYKYDKSGGISADLVTTGAQSINSLTFADIDFTVTPTGLVAGDMFDVRVAIAINDGATVTVVEGALGKLDLLCDVKG